MNIPLEPVDLSKVALVVGQGPSRGMAPWREVHRMLAEEGPTPALVMFHRPAMGRTVPDLTVASSRAALSELQREGAVERLPRVLTNHPDRMPKGTARPGQYEKILASEKTWTAPPEWPFHASGPLAVWALARMGFGTIYLFGMDGSACEESAASMRGKAPRYEEAIGHYLNARGATLEDPSPSLVRIWPSTAPWRSLKDPLEGHLRETRVVSCSEAKA